MPLKILLPRKLKKGGKLKKSKRQSLYRTATGTAEDQPHDESEEQQYVTPISFAQDESEEQHDESEDESGSENQPYESEDESGSSANVSHNIFMPVCNNVSCWGIESIVAKENSLIALGWHGFYCTLRGGDLSPEASLIMLRNVTRYLIRISQVSFLIEDSPRVGKDTTIAEFFIALIRNDKWHDAVTLAAEDYPWSAATHHTHLLQLRTALKFIRLVFMPTNNKNRDRHFRRIDAFETLLSDLLKGISKKLSRELRKKDMTVQKRVFDGTYPAGGMKELRDAALKEAARLLSLYADPPKKMMLTQNLYEDIMQTLFAVMYTTCPQGRPHGIECLLISDLVDIHGKGYATSTKFKNVKYMHYQAIIFTNIARKMLKLYVEVVRPQIKPKFQVVRDGDYLFLDYAGRQLKGIHLLIRKFFETFKGLHITSNTLRKIMETEADQRNLTEAERSAFHRMVGHGLAAATKFYILHNMNTDVQTALLAFGAPDDDPTLQQMVAAPEVVYVRDVWGADHPDPATAKRARWTDKEKEYLQNVVDDMTANDSGEPCHNILASALKIIKADVTTRPIFHARHVRDSARLRAGIRIQDEKKKK